MRETVIFILLATATLFTSTAVFAEEQAKVPMAQLCGTCHVPQPGQMMGILRDISLESKTIQMDFENYQEVVNFTDDTTVKYVENFTDVSHYKNHGFLVTFVEKNRKKFAEAIIRFDIMQIEALSEDNFIDINEFKKLRKNQNVKVYDVRPPEQYKRAHIPGAMMMPASEFESFKKNLPEDRSTQIIFYGVDAISNLTNALGTKSMGYTEVKIFPGGFPEWSQSDLTMTTPDWLKMAIDKNFPHILIDPRPAETVESGHIPGAVNIAINDLEKFKYRFPKTKNAPIILYGLASKEAADKIVSWGYKSVRVLPLSFEGWKTMGNQVASGPASYNITYTPSQKPGTISIEEFIKATKGEVDQVILVDVRNAEEFFGNRLPNTVNMPVDVVSERAELMGSKKELILFCNTGTRAEMAHIILNNDGVRSRYLDAIVTIDDDDFEVKEK